MLPYALGICPWGPGEPYRAEGKAMHAVRTDGGGGDLERFSDQVLAGSASIEALSAFERRMSWDIMGRSGFTSSTLLRSGIALSATKLKWERSWSMAIEHAAAPLKFVLTRGPGPRITIDDGGPYVLDGGTFHITQAKRPVRLHFEFGERADGQYHEELALEVDPKRLSELLGSDVLPPLVKSIVSSAAAYPRDVQPMIPDLFRLLDEIMYCDARGLSRQLYLEAKGLELLAVIVDQLEASARAASPLLSQHDIDRLERARRILLARIEAPPGLAELARHAGLNEAKLKAGFRILFGSSVYSYLRDQRLKEAHRLLRQRKYNVIEVARRVGYANPSKFAAVFRKRFGVSPSDVA